MGRLKKVREPLPPIWEAPDAPRATIEPILAEHDPPRRGPKRIDQPSTCRATLIRWDKKAENYLGLLKIACILLWIRRYDQLSQACDHHGGSAYAARDGKGTGHGERRGGVDVHP